METIETSRLDDKSRVIVPKQVKEILGLSSANRAKGERGDLVVFKKDAEGRIILEKV